MKLNVSNSYVECLCDLPLVVVEESLPLISFGFFSLSSASFFEAFKEVVGLTFLFRFGIVVDE